MLENKALEELSVIIITFLWHICYNVGIVVGYMRTNMIESILWYNLLPHPPQHTCKRYTEKKAMLVGNSYIDQVKAMEVMFECMIVCSQCRLHMNACDPAIRNESDGY